MNINIFYYIDQVKYLRDLKLSYETSENEEVSYNGLASSVPNMTRSNVKRFFQGKAQLSLKVQDKILEQMKLNKEERLFFELLSKFNNIKDPELAYGLYRKIIETRKSKVDSTLQELDSMQIRLYEHWSTLPLLYYFDIKDVSSRPADIFKAFKGEISLKQIEIGLETLEELGFISVCDGIVSKQVVGTSLLDNIPRPFIKKFHYEMANLAAESIYKLPIDKRFLTGLTIALDSKTLPVLQERITALIIQMNEEFSSPNADVLYHMNLQLFNLAVKPTDNDKMGLVH